METNLVDKLTCILHTIHRDMNLVEHLHTHHTISVVCIRQMNPRDDRCKYLPSPQDHSANEWNIGLSLDDKSGTKHDIEIFIFLKSREKVWHILDIMLPIRIKCHKIFPSILFSKRPNICKSCLKSCSSSTICCMTYKVDFFILDQVPKKILCSIY